MAVGRTSAVIGALAVLILFALVFRLVYRRYHARLIAENEVLAAKVRADKAEAKEDGLWQEAQALAAQQEALAAKRYAKANEQKDTVIDWARVAFADRLAAGPTGRLYLATKDSRPFPKLAARRLNAEVITLNGNAKLVEQCAVLRKLSHSHLLPVIGLVTDGAFNYAELMPLLPHTLDTMLQRAESNADLRTRIRAIWLEMACDIADGLGSRQPPCAALRAAHGHPARPCRTPVVSH